MKKTMTALAVALIVAAPTAAVWADNDDSGSEAEPETAQVQEREQARLQVHDPGEGVAYQEREQARLQVHDPGEGVAYQEREQARLQIHEPGSADCEGPSGANGPADSPGSGNGSPGNGNQGRLGSGS